MHTLQNKGIARGLERRAQPLKAPFSARPRRVMPVVVAAFAPPTVSQTKEKFLHSYSKPVMPVYNTVVQELLVQQHFIRYNVNYKYNAVYALGVVSAFDQILESLEPSDRTEIFSAYVRSLDEDPAVFRRDAEELEKTASELSGPDQITVDADGSALQKALASVAELTAANKFNYNKFFAIGLFRLLELTGAKEPSALERLVKAVGVKPESVNRDLMLYKGILSKLSAAKELQREFLERERKKQAERDAAKASKAAEGEAAQNPVTASS